MRFKFRVKITGRIPFLKPVNLTPIDVRLSVDQAANGTAFLASIGSENLKGTVRLGPYALQVVAVIEPRV